MAYCDDYSNSYTAGWWFIAGLLSVKLVNLFDYARFDNEGVQDIDELLSGLVRNQPLGDHEPSLIDGLNPC